MKDQHQGCESNDHEFIISKESVAKLNTSMITSIGKADARYEILERGHNRRWPLTAEESADRIEFCESAEDVVEALQKIVDSGRRPTVRSGGHCYEDFVANNPGGTILDVSCLGNSVPHSTGGDGGRYRVSAGNTLGRTYADLYKRHGVTIPGGSCVSVGAGGHISGGGYGLLSRRHGLTVDWLSAVEIVTINHNGKAEWRRVDKDMDADLFRACRGAGGGNFGVITGYLFDKLPAPPTEVVNGGVSFDWATMSEARFVDIVMKFGEYWTKRGKDEDTWGLFSGLSLSHSASGRMGVGLQFFDTAGSCKDLTVAREFLDLFADCHPLQEHVAVPGAHIQPPASGGVAKKPCPAVPELDQSSWLEATISGGAGMSARAKYKSTYMKTNFTAAEAKCIYRHLRTPVPGVKHGRPLLAVDSYGGATNKVALAGETAVPQRASTMKLQFQAYWSNPKDDSGYLQWMSDFYSDLYSGEKVSRPFAGTPYPGSDYEGCYINYPDKDMLAYPFWPQLFYGDGDLYPFLQGVKEKYDPHNVFHHAMSVRPGKG